MRLKWRRLVAVIISLFSLGLVIVLNTPPATEPVPPSNTNTQLANEALEQLPEKGKAPKTDYSRDQFGSGWATTKGCDTRNIILYRDLTNTELDDDCSVIRGTLQDSYTNKTIIFTKGDGAAVQIDHVVALSNAWQTGAQQLSRQQRVQLANDPLNLIAVDGPANQEKSDADAATWIPPNKPFRCEYVARQIAVKQKYDLWVVVAEKQAMETVLKNCPEQRLPSS